MDLNITGSEGGSAEQAPHHGHLAALPTLHDLTPEQRGSLARIKTTNTALYRAYLLKEQLRAVFAVTGQRGKALLAGWIAWARRSRLPELVTLARTIQRFQQLIWNTLRHNLSNALDDFHPAMVSRSGATPGIGGHADVVTLPNTARRANGPTPRASDLHRPRPRDDATTSG